MRYNLFGLGMVMIGFTFFAYLALLFSAISYMPLGHVGSKQRSRGEDEIPARTTSRVKLPENNRTVGVEDGVKDL